MELPQWPVSPFWSSDAQGRSLYAYPLRGRVLDWPQRWGDKGAGTWYASETHLRFSRGHLAIGVGFRSRWIGLGRLNALFWGTHMPAYPHLWGETARPLSAGSLRLEVLGWVGQLWESRFYDLSLRNDRRLISGLLGQAHLLARDQILTLELVSIAYRTWAGAEEVVGAPLHALSLPLRSRWAPWMGLYGFFPAGRLLPAGAGCRGHRSRCSKKNWASIVCMVEMGNTVRISPDRLLFDVELAERFRDYLVARQGGGGRWIS